ncbi:DNA polymerase-4 [Pedobacter sp. AK017]|uniref:DNA polymerase IV n=1 Tax=Pedobacter sp. AK017 TaxID=2723073 RepID=UPI001616FD86|nr:DNA polymerase IV [Pedobacter sp. AK017]MBB5437922.1 DNA polymerase-4 [Pedobacter sp. AK017]
MRKIIHIDMDSFYASVEQRDHPDLMGKAIAVGGSPEGRGGVVATASYEARKFGVHSAMPSKQALKLCPHLIFVYPRFAVYKEVSKQIRTIFQRYTDLIEPLSLDEAYLDVTNDKLGIGSAIDIARQIKQAIKDELKLTASAGISINKFVSKIASGMNKPDGLTFVGPSGIERFIAQLPVEKFHGVGKVTAGKMKLRGLHKGADLKKLTETELINLFGKSGRFFYNIVRGIDNRPVEPNQETKSISAEDTFSYDLTKFEEMNPEIEKIANVVFKRMKQYGLAGRTVTLKVKFSDFKQITRSKSSAEGISELNVILDIARSLLAGIDFTSRSVRLLGLSLSNFGHLGGRTAEVYQPRLFP